MSFSSIIDEVETSFQDFCTTTPTAKLRRFMDTDEPCCLMDFVQAWVECGEGVRVSNADFSTYMVALVVIIDGWRRHPSITDYVAGWEHPESSKRVERHMDTIFGSDGPDDHTAFDRLWFEEQAFKTKYPHLRNPISPW